jgi:acyl dehydratase
MKIISAMTEKENLGQFHGMVWLEAAVKNPAFPEDTLHVEVEACVDRKTSRGQTLVDLKHAVMNQRNEIVTVFTEKLLFEPISPSP